MRHMLSLSRRLDWLGRMVCVGLAVMASSLVVSPAAAEPTTSAADLAALDPESRVYQVYLDRRYGKYTRSGGNVATWQTTAAIATVATPLLVAGALLFDVVAVGGAKREATSAYDDYVIAAQNGVDFRVDAA